KKIDNEKSETVQNLKIGKIKLEQEINSINQTKSSLINQMDQICNEIDREKIIINDSQNKMTYLSDEISSL